jgi:beta-glucosidase
MTVNRNLLKAHGEAYRAIHRLQPKARVGLAHNFMIFDPANPRSFLDRLVAWGQDMGYNQSVLNAIWQGWWTPPLGFGPVWPLRHTLDWVGLNYYTRSLVTFDQSAKATLYGKLSHDPKAEPLDGGYGELYPEGLYRSLKYWHGWASLSTSPRTASPTATTTNAPERSCCTSSSCGKPCRRISLCRVTTTGR